MKLFVEGCTVEAKEEPRAKEQGKRWKRGNLEELSLKVVIQPRVEARSRAETGKGGIG